MYAGMFTLWIASAATRAFARRLLSSHPAEDYDSDSRYKDDVTQLQGQLHDLIIALGQECFAQVDAKNCKWFAKLVRSILIHTNELLHLTDCTTVTDLEWNELVSVRYGLSNQKTMSFGHLWHRAAKSGPQNP
jgi:hypothetical protein